MKDAPQLLTTGRLAELLDSTPERVAYIIRTRKIAPVARAGNLRLFNRAAMDRIAKILTGDGKGGNA